MRARCVTETTLGAGTSAPGTASASACAPTGGRRGITEPVSRCGGGGGGDDAVAGGVAHGAEVGSRGTMRGRSLARGASTPWKRVRG